MLQRLDPVLSNSTRMKMRNVSSKNPSTKNYAFQKSTKNMEENWKEFIKNRKTC